MKNIKLNFMVSEEMAQDLKRITEKYNTTISKLLRKTLKRVIKAEFG